MAVAKLFVVNKPQTNGAFSPLSTLFANLFLSPGYYAKAGKCCNIAVEERRDISCLKVGGRITLATSLDTKCASVRDSGIMGKQGGGSKGEWVGRA